MPGLAVVRDQLLVTFEAACRLAGDMGTVAFVVDMHGLQPHLNLDMRAMKATADMLGTVYAERICRNACVCFCPSSCISARHRVWVFSRARSLSLCVLVCIYLHSRLDVCVCVFAWGPATFSSPPAGDAWACERGARRWLLSRRAEMP